MNERAEAIRQPSRLGIEALPLTLALGYLGLSHLGWLGYSILGSLFAADEGASIGTQLLFFASWIYFAASGAVCIRALFRIRRLTRRGLLLPMLLPLPWTLLGLWVGPWGLEHAFQQLLPPAAHVVLLRHYLRLPRTTSERSRP